MSTSVQIRPLSAQDRPWVARLVAEHWGAETVVVHDTLYRPADLPGWVAWWGDERIGLLTYQFHAGDCEIVTLDSLLSGIGVGAALVEAARQAAQDAGCRRLWLVTTNDNLNALRFYQKRGWRLAAVYPGAVERARRLKPEIPLVGANGIPLRDEIELEITLE
jgi:GNAT superfamily N-acetyltransferase